MTAAQPYFRPDTLDEALAALAEHAPRIAAGCTDLFPATDRKTLTGPILDITGIKALRGISKDGNGLTIGATTTWADVIRAPLPPAFDGLKLAAREVGGPQIQNQGTVAGNLCNASPAADGVPPLLTLDAQVVLRSASGERQTPLLNFLTGPRQTTRTETELLTAIRITREAMAGHSHFLKLGARKYLVISIAMAAARVTVENGLVTAAALSVGSCGPVATRLGEAERAIVGAPLDTYVLTDDLIEQSLSPIDDIRADAGYRLTSAAELLRRTLRALAEKVPS